MLIEVTVYSGKRTEILEQIVFKANLIELPLEQDKRCQFLDSVRSEIVKQFDSMTDKLRGIKKENQ